MASTNKTTHYELSQYIGTDKPTYLTDYNQDMSRIDAGIYGAKSLADVNESAIGTLANLSTTAKSDLVSAINEVDGDVATNTANISTNTSNISTNSTNIGNLNNLTTASKSNLVSAINEVDANSDSNANKIGDLTTLTTTAKTNLVSATNEVNSKINNFNLTDFDSCTVTGSSSTVTVTEVNVSCAKNTDGSLFKIYGNITLIANAWDSGTTLTISGTGLPAIDTAYDIYGAVLEYKNEGAIIPKSITYNTDGSLTISSGSFGASSTMRLYLPPCLYFNANFGDTSR